MRSPPTIYFGVAVATLLSGCLLDWDGPRPGGHPADIAVEARLPDAPSDLSPDCLIREDTYRQDAPPPPPDAAPADLLDAAPADLSDATPPDLAPPDAQQPDSTPGCSYLFIAANSVTSLATQLNQKKTAGWRLFRYSQDPPGHSALLLDSGGTYKLLFSSNNPVTLASSVNAALTSGGSIVVFRANVNTHVVWLKGTTGDYKPIVSSSVNVADLVNKELNAGWKVHSFADTAAAFHTVWLQGSGAYLHLSTSSPTNLTTAVNSKVSLGYTPVGYISKNIHAIWLRKGSSYELFTSTSSSSTTVAAPVTSKVSQGASVEAFASASGLHAAWLRKGSSYTLRQSSFGGSLNKVVNQDVAAGWQVQALLSRDRYSAWLESNYCP